MLCYEGKKIQLFLNRDSNPGLQSDILTAKLQLFSKQMYPNLISKPRYIFVKKIMKTKTGHIYNYHYFTGCQILNEIKV